MNFQISALSPERFSHMFGKDTGTLARLGAVRVVADEQPGFPCRVSLEDAAVGESLLLVNYEHLPVNSPYRSRHAIFVREGAAMAQPAVNEVPQSLASRLLSIRAFDADGMLVDSDVVDGREADLLIRKLFEDESTRYLHIHNAKPGCYAARVERA